MPATARPSDVGRDHVRVNGFEIIEEMKRKGGLSYIRVLACIKALVNVFRDEVAEER
jgi:hypothetical protein